MVFNGKSIPLKTERLKIAFKKLENHQGLIEEAEIQKGDSSALIKLYLTFSDILDDTQLVVKKEK